MLMSPLTTSPKELLTEFSNILALRVKLVDAGPKFPGNIAGSSYSFKKPSRKMQNLFNHFFPNHLGRRVLHSLFLIAAAFACASSGSDTFAIDYVMTIGGGYEPAGNQASLEANVLFFQQLVDEQFPRTTRHQVFFADGLDSQADLQVMAPKSETASPTIALLETAFSVDQGRLSYRNHQVPNVRGPISPKSIRMGLDEIAESLTDRDRLIVYVTAHGSPGQSKDSMNTSITCWRKQALSMKTFSEWLDRLPSRVPVVLVMAQCYCGGFANSMFAAGNIDNGLAKGVRVGFFAQRFDLPAAGCRPDIVNDEEYSSYFWGAFMGRSRTGKIAEGVDCDRNGRISFDEAHAFAVRASQTIDIPLKTSDMFLRHYSRIAGYASTHIKGSPSDSNQREDDPTLEHFTGRLQDIANLGSLPQRITIESLASQLALPMDSEVAEVFRKNEAQSEIFQQSRLGVGRRGAGGPNGRRGTRNSGRRDFQKEIVESWPDLSNPADWNELSWLKGNEGESILDELRHLPSFETYNKSMEERRLAREKASASELKDVQFKRLVHTMESIVLGQNIARLASQEVLMRYREIIELESSLAYP